MTLLTATMMTYAVRMTRSVPGDKYLGGGTHFTFASLRVSPVLENMDWQSDSNSYRQMLLLAGIRFEVCPDPSKIFRILASIL